MTTMRTVDEGAIQSRRALVAVVAFLLVVIILMIIALFNAPTMGGPRVMATVDSYMAEVRRTALPFLGAVALVAIALGLAVARVVYREWPNPKRRTNLIMGYLFLAPYLLITLIFTVGVVLFAFYISFNSYDIFTPPQWVGLANYARAFEGFVNPAEADFLRALHNVLWYAFIVVPTQTAIAILLAVLLNAPNRFRQFFRTIFYAPSVTSSVVITFIFIWIYLRTGYGNYFISNFLGIF